MALAGRLLLNFARTIPLLPCARVTFPQITRVLLGFPPGVTVFLRAHTHTHTLRNTPTLTVNERWRCGSSLLGLVDVGAAFAEVEVDLVPAVAALELQQRRVLALVPQAALVARKDGLTPQSERETASDHVTTTC